MKTLKYTISCDETRYLEYDCEVTRFNEILYDWHSLIQCSTFLMANSSSSSRYKRRPSSHCKSYRTHAAVILLCSIKTDKGLTFLITLESFFRSLFHEKSLTNWKNMFLGSSFVLELFSRRKTASPTHFYPHSPFKIKTFAQSKFVQQFKDFRFTSL